MNKDHYLHLYKHGVTSFPMLTSVQCARIIQEAKMQYTFEPATPEVGKRKVQQLFSEITISPRSTIINTNVLGVQKYLADWLRRCGGSTVMDPLFQFREIRMHRYPIGGKLEYHKDNAVFRNIIANVLLKGESNFYVADDVYGTNARLIEAKPGWVIVLAAPGLFGKKWQRPHCVANVTMERISLGMRDGILAQE